MVFVKNIYDVAEAFNAQAECTVATTEFLHISNLWYCVLLVVDSNDDVTPVSAGHGHTKEDAATWCFRNWLDHYGRP